MQYRRLGKTELNVSIIGFGASPLRNVFEDCDEKVEKVKKGNVLMKMLVVVLILLILAIIFVILSGFIDFNELYKTLLS